MDVAHRGFREKTKSVGQIEEDNADVKGPWIRSFCRKQIEKSDYSTIKGLETTDTCWFQEKIIKQSPFGIIHKIEKWLKVLIQ